MIQEIHKNKEIKVKVIVLELDIQIHKIILMQVINLHHKKSFQKHVKLMKQFKDYSN